MSYEVTLRRPAQKGLDAIHEQDYVALAQALSGLEDNPRPTRVKKLGGSGLWRIRVGQYRVVYAVDDGVRRVTVVRVVRRQEDTYKGL